jgi:hypothetical protein
MRLLRPVVLWMLLAAIPATASAVTVDQIVALKKAGVTDAVVLALIERDHTVFSLQPEQIVALQRDGLSEEVIIAMLKSGQAGEDAARADSAYATAMVAAAMAPGPEVLIVGHGPERPNTYHYDGFFTSANNPYLFPLHRGALFQSYAAPYEPSAPGVVPIAPAFGVQRVLPRGDRVGQRSLCYAQVTSGPSRSNSLSFVTECPRVLQPRRVR